MAAPRKEGIEMNVHANSSEPTTLNEKSHSRRSRRARNPAVEHVLTERQWEVLELKAEGLGYKQVSDRLHLSVSTVSNHLADARERLGVKNSTEAFNKAFFWHTMGPGSAETMRQRTGGTARRKEAVASF